MSPKTAREQIIIEARLSYVPSLTIFSKFKIIGIMCQLSTIYTWIEIQDWLFRVATLSQLIEMNLAYWTNNISCFKITLCMATSIPQLVNCFLGVWCILKKSNITFICSKLVMGPPCFKRWKIATNWIFFFLLCLPSIDHQLCNRVWTSTSISPFISLVSAIIVDIRLINQNSWMKN